MTINQQQYERPKIEAATEAHLACVLLLDTSGSMSGQPIISLNRAIREFKEKVSLDEEAKKRLDVAIVEFNDHANIVQDFTPVCDMKTVTLEAGGLTAMGEGINTAIDLVKDRNRLYSKLGTPCHKPWIFMITDGIPTDDITFAASRIVEEEKKGKYGHLKFWALGVSDYDANTLFQLTKRVLALDETKFEGIFNWLAESMAAISVSQVGEQVRSAVLPDNVRVVPKEWDD